VKDRRLPTITLVAALVVLVAGIAAALTHHDDGSHDTIGFTPTSVPAFTTTTRAAIAPATLPGLTVPAVVPPSTTATTVKPAVPDPESAARGLFEAYMNGDRTGAARFATPDVIQPLFATPYDGNAGTFQGCSARGSSFVCHYTQDATGATYEMIAEKQTTSGSFKVVEITITRPVPTTSTTTTTTASSSASSSS